jgi:hypothetical protein
MMLCHDLTTGAASVPHATVISSPYWLLCGVAGLLATEDGRTPQALTDTLLTGGALERAAEMLSPAW